MKRVLLDENLPRKLRHDLSEFAVRTVQEENWTSFANGELLGLAQERFDVLLTADRRLQFQQNLARFDIGVVVILTVSLQYRRIRAGIEEIRQVLGVIRPVNCYTSRSLERVCRRERATDPPQRPSPIEVAGAILQLPSTFCSVMLLHKS